MTIVGALEKALGKNQKKVFAATLSVASGDTVDTGLASIDYCEIVPVNTAPRDAHPKSISGGVITVGLWDGDPTLAAVTEITTAETVMIIAIGNPK